MTDEIPAPLDAYETAKPGEPTFTLQGGDPLAAPLIIMWARFARALCGLGIEPAATMFHLDKIVAENQVDEGSRERESLLIRATEAEKVSWAMDEYRKGIAFEEREIPKLAHEFDRLDVYDIRRRCSSLISNFFGELNEYKAELIKHGFIIENDELDNAIFSSILALQSILRHVEIRKTL